MVKMHVAHTKKKMLHHNGVLMRDHKQYCFHLHKHIYRAAPVLILRNKKGDCCPSSALNEIKTKE